MLIGQFCETYPPTVDGVGRVMYSYCKHLKTQGHRALYVAPDNRKFAPPEDCETLLYGGVSVPGEAYRAGFPRLSKRYRRQVRGLRFDVLHAHSPFFAAREARRLAKRDGAPLVATFHSKYYDDFLKATHSRLIAKAVVAYIVRFYHSCDEVWAVNRQTGDVLKSYGYRGDIQVMPNGTDPFLLTHEQRRDALRRYPVPDGIPVLIFAGQQNLKKNPDSVLKACAILKKRGMEFYLIMVGSGPDENKLHDLARKLGIGQNVLFTGFLSERPALMALYERADLLVFPSLYDNAPMVVREAAAMGTPSLLIEGSCAAEGITHGENGYLCQNSPGAIASAVAKALTTADAVGQGAKRTIPVPWNEIILAVEARYNTLIQAKQKGTTHET
ncbi:MAG: glycosyltransferase [Clostridiales bacterium]|nr:glycosyltransferase [Clostridiales bacterium]